MRKGGRWALVLLVAAASIGSADQSPSELEQNRRRLEEIRKDPVRQAGLQAQLEAFLREPVEEQARLRQLDRDLRGLSPAETQRLHRVLERYRSWLDALPEADRTRVIRAPNAEERLRCIRDIRQAQWISRLPKAYRDRLIQTSGEQRAELIKQFQQAEKRRNHEWDVALRHWDDLLKGQTRARLQDYGPAVQTFANDYLRPRLSREEAQRLEEANGKWPDFPQTLVELADKHPPPFPGPLTGPTRFSELPKNVQETLAKHLKPQQINRLRTAEGLWPEYAERVEAMARFNHLTLPEELGPCRLVDFNPAVQRFIDQELLPVLTPEERARLQRAKGHWPNYPRSVQDLARKHHLHVPGIPLPGPPELWDKFRSHPTAEEATGLPSSLPTGSGAAP